VITDQTEAMPLPVAQVALQAQIDRFGTDRQIDEGFATFGDPVSSLIFYAPKLGEDVLIRELGKLRSNQDFFSSPPIEVSYTKNGKNLPFGKFYTIFKDQDGQMKLRYEQTRQVALGAPVMIEGHEIVFSYAPDGNLEAKDVMGLMAAVQGEPTMVSDFRLTTPPLRQGEELASVDTLSITYQHTEPISADGRVLADDFAFTIKSNPDSPYTFDQGEAYAFQVTEVMFLPLVIVMLLLGAVIFTLYFGFVNFRRFGLAINVVRGKYSDPTEEGEVSHFQALTAALSGTVGLGNIAGVAIAISVGGAGATFWMILAGLLGMSSKFVECTLGVKYRTIDRKGEVSGGPMYYLSAGLAKRGMAGLGKVLAAFFAIMCIGGSFGGGNMFQVNQAFKQFASLSFTQDTWIAANGWFFGVIMAGLVAIVIIGGIRSIAKVTDKIVPFMTGLYVLAALVIIIMYIEQVPQTFVDIFEGAFAPKAIAGGFIGVLIQGFRRAAFSNEAGVGSASIAHSAVKTNNPASEGIVALLEPFIDTVLVCTMTALVIIITDNHLDPSASDGVALTSKAFSSEIPVFKYLLSVAVILFAFSTMITWSYYGLKAWTYLFGGSRAADISYKVLFCLFVVIGAAASLGSVTNFSDAMIFAMAFPNVIGLLILAPEVRQELRSYIGKIKSGEIIRVK
jgi:AGCS family alanine or glycine:cation symporter